MPRPDIAPLLSEKFVALASDCDDPQDEVLAMAARLEDAMMLPFVLIATPDGELVEGSSGSVTPDALRGMLERATS